MIIYEFSEEVKTTSQKNRDRKEKQKRNLKEDRQNVTSRQECTTDEIGDLGNCRISINRI